MLLTTNPLTYHLSLCLRLSSAPFLKSPDPVKAMFAIFRHTLGSLFLSALVFATMPAEARAESLLEKILKFVGISATPSQLKGPGDEIGAGDIWVANLVQKTRVRLTREGDYQSPVFLPADENILALKGNHVVRISVFGGEPEFLTSIPGIVKLVGVSKDGPDQLLILSEDDASRLSVGLLSLTSGRVTNIPYGSSRDDRRMIKHLRGWERVYGDTTVYIKHQINQAMAGAEEWTDVYVKQGQASPINVSRCDRVNCGQPSLSHDRTRVVFVKAGQ